MGEFLCDDYKYFQEDNVSRTGSNHYDSVLSRFEAFNDIQYHIPLISAVPLSVKSYFVFFLHLLRKSRSSICNTVSLFILKIKSPFKRLNALFYQKHSSI